MKTSPRYLLGLHRSDECRRRIWAQIEFFREQEEITWLRWVKMIKENLVLFFFLFQPLGSLKKDMEGSIPLIFKNMRAWIYALVLFSFFKESKYNILLMMALSVYVCMLVLKCNMSGRCCYFTLHAQERVNCRSWLSTDNKTYCI